MIQITILSTIMLGVFFTLTLLIYSIVKKEKFSLIMTIMSFVFLVILPIILGNYFKENSMFGLNKSPIDIFNQIKEEGFNETIKSLNETEKEVETGKEDQMNKKVEEIVKIVEGNETVKENEERTEIVKTIEEKLNKIDGEVVEKTEELIKKGDKKEIEKLAKKDSDSVVKALNESGKKELKVEEKVLNNSEKEKLARDNARILKAYELNSIAGEKFQSEYLSMPLAEQTRYGDNLENFSKLSGLEKEESEKFVESIPVCSNLLPVNHSVEKNIPFKWFGKYLVEEKGTKKEQYMDFLRKFGADKIDKAGGFIYKGTIGENGKIYYGFAFPLEIGNKLSQKDGGQLGDRWMEVGNITSSKYAITKEDLDCMKLGGKLPYGIK